jgi:uncharacterized protein (UPF0261 family)
MAIVVIGTLDTKGAELDFVRQTLRNYGHSVILIDASVLGSSPISSDISPAEVFAAAGVSLNAVQAQNNRGQAVELAAKGVAQLVSNLHKQGKVSGILGLGGSAGTTIATAGMRTLPLGIPKLMVSTLASGPVQGWVDVKDILMMPAISDFCGLNRISRQILLNAVAALSGMVSQQPIEFSTDRPIIVASMFGVTTPCVEQARRILDAAGYEVVVFHATGVGGRTMESLIRDGVVAGVLDITTTELADELVGGILSAGRDRLTAAALKGIPQVISVGALDMVNFGPLNTVPEKFAQRRFHVHNPMVTLMRTTPEENDELGKEIAHKACASRGPTAVLLPKGGISAIDKMGGPFWWPEADQALFQSLRNWSSTTLKIHESDAHINDPEFAQLAAETLLKMF